MKTARAVTNEFGEFINREYIESDYYNEFERSFTTDAFGKPITREKMLESARRGSNASTKARKQSK